MKVVQSIGCTEKLYLNLGTEGSNFTLELRHS